MTALNGPSKPLDCPVPLTVWRSSAFLFFVLLVALPAAAEEPELEFGPEGLSKVMWRGANIIGDRRFALERLVFETRDNASDGLWGRAFTDAPVSPQRVDVRAGEKRVVHEYPWGSVGLACEPGPNRLSLVLTLVNKSDRTIADFQARLLEFLLDRPQAMFRDGLVRLALDQPVVFRIPFLAGACFVTYDAVFPPLQFGLGPARQMSRKRDSAGRIGHDLIVLGGAPALDRAGDMPVLGFPRVPADGQLSMTFVLRFGAPDMPDESVIRPYYDAYHASWKPHLNWPDRRPLGRVVIPSSPRFVTQRNPRGWFGRSPQLNVGTEQGQQVFRQKLMELADLCVKRLQEAGAQGMIVWNIEGGNSYPATPMGDPRRLADIAPEMDAAADVFFARFREQGLRVGVCIRPSLLHFSERSQDWVHGIGTYDPEHETLPAPFDQLSREEARSARLYPLVERLAAKIAYARQRWGCTVFYIHDNGFWWQPSKGRSEEWLYMNGRVLQLLRERHPDVLLIPRYAEQHWRSARPALILATKNFRARPQVDALRGLGEDRVGGIATPRWVIGNGFRCRQARFYSRPSERPVPGPPHVLRPSYWAHSAPYVELRLERLIREYVTTLEQNVKPSPEQAAEIAAKEVPFVTTPDRVREWMPDAFSVIDIAGARIGTRRAALERAAAWGEVLMWDAAADPAEVRSIYGAASAKQKRVEAIARAVGVLPAAPEAPLTALSLVWRLGQTLDPAGIVTDRPVPPRLRLRLAYGPKRQRALLMLAWPGGMGRRVRLKPSLPGIDLVGAVRNVWQLPTGALLDNSAGIDVESDPAAGIRVLLLQGGDEKRAARPPGVLIGADFNHSVAPVLGRPPPLFTQADPAVKPAKTKGAALQLDGHSAARFNVVPDWSEGTAEFDLKISLPIRRPLPVLTIGRHLDLALALEERGGKPGLALQARDTGLEPREAAPAGTQTEMRKAFGPLPGGGDRWHRIVLVWDLGQYRLYANGKQIAAIEGAVRLRRRDGTVLKPGVVLGGGSDNVAAGTQLDNFVVYEWAFPPEAAASRQRTDRLQPLVRQNRRAPTVWVWGSFPKKVVVGVNARGVRRWAGMEAARITLYERRPFGRRQLGQADVGLQGGVALAAIPYKPGKGIEAGAAAGGDGGGDSRPDTPGLLKTDDLDDIDDLADELDVGQPYSIVVQPLPETKSAPARSVNLTAAKEGVKQHRW